jgi:hemerythrin
MALMTWNEQLSVHIKQIDDQHKLLVKLLNSFHDAMKLGKGKEAMRKTLSELLDYTVYHFGVEEGFLEKHAYPAFASHKTEHEALTKKVSDLDRRFSRGEPVISAETMTFLKDWLQDHIMGSDKKYAPFLNAKGID